MSLSLVDESSAKARVVVKEENTFFREDDEERRTDDDDDESDDFDWGDTTHDESDGEKSEALMREVPKRGSCRFDQIRSNEE